MDSHGALAETVGAPVLVFDGGCPFCRHFAELSALRSGIPDLQIRDGRQDASLRQALSRRGYRLVDGAILLVDADVLHGDAAIQWLCSRMTSTAPLLRLLGPLFAEPQRARGLYPLLLLARRLALTVKGVPIDPDAAAGSGFVGQVAGAGQQVTHHAREHHDQQNQARDRG